MVDLTPNYSTSIEYPSETTYRMYIKFWWGQQASLFGSAIVMFAVLFFLAYLPTVIFSPLAGMVADHFDKKKIILISDSLQAFLTVVLFVCLFFIKENIWLFITINTLRSVCQAFHNPVGFTLPAIFVPKDKITRINGRNFLISNLTNIFAVPIAASLMMVFDLQLILWLDVISFAFAFIPLIKLKFPEKIDPTGITQPNNTKQNNEKKNVIERFFFSLKEGIKSIYEISGLMNIIILATFLNFFFNPFDTLLINFIKYSHHGTEVEYSIFTASIRAGIFIGAIFVTIKKAWRHWIFYMLAGFLSMAICIIIIAIIPKEDFLWLYITGFFILLLNPVVNTLFQSLIQLKVPQEKMGRVISLIMTISAFLSPIGILLAGPIADATSIETVYIGSGLGGIIMVLLLFFRPKVLAVLKEGERASNETVENL